jgi:type I restriction enzyme S subunit
MALKTITVKSETLKEHTHNRFDFGYYYIQQFFENLNKHFNIKTVNQLKDYIISGSYINKYFSKSSETIPYIRVATVKHFFLNENESDFVFVSKNVPDKIKTKLNDIVIGRTAVLGIASIIDEHTKNFAISQHITRLKLKEKIISPEFVVAYLNSSLFKGQMIIASSGTSRLELTHSQLGNVKIVMPDKEFEDKIKKKVKKSIELHRQALLYLQQAQQLFYQKLNIDFSKIQKEKHYSVKLSDFKDDNLWTPAFSYPLYVNTLKAIQKKWKTVPLGEIATIKKGDEVGSVNYNKYLDKKDADIPFIRTSDLVNYEVDQFPDFYIPEEIYQELKQDIKAGDVLFTKDGKIGMSAMITKNDKAIIASGMVRLRLKTEAKKYNLTPEYLFVVLSLKETGLYPAIRRTVVASTIPHLREERLKEFEIPILDKNSIDEITKLVKEAFELKDEKKKLIKEVRKEIDNYFEA